MFRRATLTAVLAVGLLFAARAAAQAPEVPPASPEPSAEPSLAPTPAPSAAPTPTAAPAARPLSYIVTPATPAAGAPGILEVALSDRIVRLGATMVAWVTTTPDITGVVFTAYGARLAMFPGPGPGRFSLQVQVPARVPEFYLERDYTVTVLATAGDGRTASTNLPLRLSR